MTDSHDVLRCKMAFFPQFNLILSKGRTHMVKTTPQNTTASDAAATDPVAGSADARAATFGRVLALMMASPRHSMMSLAEANASVAPPLALGQIALMGAKRGEATPMALAAAAWWAFVSPEVDERLTASREPHLKLDPTEWRSGDQPWIIEAIGDPRIVSELIKTLADRQFRGQTAKLRAVLPDGRVAVGRLDPTAVDAAQSPNAKATPSTTPKKA
jgi:cytolysin-activating lysine-acyltransferase